MSESTHNRAFGASLVVYFVIGAIWAVFAILTIIYGDPNEPLQNIGRVVMSAGIGVTVGIVIVRRLSGVNETPPQHAERPGNS